MLKSNACAETGLWKPINPRQAEPGTIISISALTIDEVELILTGWKEISKYLRYGVRTLQRWEGNGLPVKRISNGSHSPVVADSEELDAWILHRIVLPPGAPRELADNLQRTRELRRESQERRKELRARIEVLRKTVAEARAKLRK